MSTVNIVVQVQGTADEEDRRAMNFMIAQENARRAALVPPEAPLPNTDAATRRASYEAILAPRIVAAHRSYIAESDTVTRQELLAAFASANETKRAAALAALQ